MNCFTAIGRLGRNPEERTTSTGKLMTTFSIAIDDGKGCPPIWTDCTCFDKTAEIAARYLKKGDQCGIQGSLTVREYTNREGQTVKAWGCNVQRLDLLGGGKGQEQREEQRPTAPAYDDTQRRNGQLAAVANIPRAAADFDDNVPF